MALIWHNSLCLINTHLVILGHKRGKIPWINTRLHLQWPSVVPKISYSYINLKIKVILSVWILLSLSKSRQTIAWAHPCPFILSNRGNFALVVHKLFHSQSVPIPLKKGETGTWFRHHNWTFGIEINRTALETALFRCKNQFNSPWTIVETVSRQWSLSQYLRVIKSLAGMFHVRSLKIVHLLLIRSQWPSSSKNWNLSPLPRRTNPGGYLKDKMWVVKTTSGDLQLNFWHLQAYSSCSTSFFLALWTLERVRWRKSWNSLENLKVTLRRIGWFEGAERFSGLISLSLLSSTTHRTTRINFSVKANQ